MRDCLCYHARVQKKQGVDLRDASAQSFGVRRVSTSDEFTCREVYRFCLPLGILAHKGPIKGPQPATGQGIAATIGQGLAPRLRLWQAMSLRTRLCDQNGYGDAVMHRKQKIHAHTIRSVLLERVPDQNQFKVVERS